MQRLVTAEMGQNLFILAVTCLAPQVPVYQRGP